MDFPKLSKGDLGPDQTELWNELTTGPRGFYTGGPDTRALPELYNAWLQFPEFGQLMLKLADSIRAQPDLSAKRREILVLTTSVKLGCRIEYDFHSVFARHQGLSDAVITAIGEGADPPFDDAGDRAVYDANIELVKTGTLTDTTRDAVTTAIGLPGLMQLIAAVGLYTVVAYSSNVARVEMAKDFKADGDKLKSFFDNNEA
ncbi:MAG TPA: carboxymuconolactone decarboxylase family protein [Sphingomonas sp.]|nr:carboxymuconolactone decarboxylase family protein [Sphingomonas sp.]